MHQITRRLMSFALAAAMLLALTITAQVASADDGKSALKYAPQDTMMVLSINMSRFKEAQIYKSALGIALKEKEVKEMIDMLKAKAGFDIQNDIESFVVIVPPDVEKSENFLIVAQGKFDAPKIIALMKEQGAELAEANYAGIKYHIIDGEGALLFSGNQALLGTDAMLKKALDVSSGKAPAIKGNAGMTKLLGAVDTSKDIWFAMSFTDELKKAMGSNPMIKDITSVTSSFDFKAGFGLHTIVGTANAGAATSLTQMLQGMIKQTAGDPTMKQMGLDAVLNNTKVKNVGADIDIDLKISDADFQKLQQTLMGLMGGF